MLKKLGFPLVFCFQVTEDGKCSTVENNLLPDENLSLDQFIRETENVSECDVLQVLVYSVGVLLYW